MKQEIAKLENEKLQLSDEGKRLLQMTIKMQVAEPHQLQLQILESKNMQLNQTPLIFQNNQI